MIVGLHQRIFAKQKLCFYASIRTKVSSTVIICMIYIFIFFGWQKYKYMTMQMFQVDLFFFISTPALRQARGKPHPLCSTRGQIYKWQIRSNQSQMTSALCCPAISWQMAEHSARGTSVKKAVISWTFPLQTFSGLLDLLVCNLLFSEKRRKSHFVSSEP